MSLDFTECDQARLARDAAYDGRFYTGVHTTGIYCRPVCPVRPARSANVSFFPSAAAAEAAGFRPCLRCRPETAPFSSAWIGSRATVERALRLIVEEGALDQEGATVERLAQRLGVGSRQLTRLFARHLQASPSKVARTARVQRAKRLLDETSLPMTEIAMRAGFGSLRRFNSVFVEVYGRPPTEFGARGERLVRPNKRSMMSPRRRRSSVLVPDLAGPRRQRVASAHRRGFGLRSGKGPTLLIDALPVDRTPSHPPCREARAIPAPRCEVFKPERCAGALNRCTRAFSSAGERTSGM